MERYTFIPCGPLGIIELGNIIVIIIVLRGVLECCGTRGIVSVASVSGTLNHTHVEKNKPFGFPLARLFTQTAGHVPRACLDRGGFSKL